MQPTENLLTSVQFLDPQVWFGNRELGYKPLHFITATTPLTKESALWVIHTLSGRYTFTGSIGLNDQLEEVVYPSFEETADAVMYELRWS